MVVGLDLTSHDATVVGQVFFYLPVLSAATQLKLPGAVLVTVLAVAAEATVVLDLLPTQEALTSLAFVGTTLVTTAVALGRAGVLQDRLVAELQRQAAVDPLTRLLTRRVLDEATVTAVNAAQRPQADATSLLLIDVDRFKLINDQYGHVAGDAALSHIAEVISRCRRSGDVVARMGGDEFAVLLPGCGYEHALRMAQELVDEIQAVPLRLKDGQGVPLSISIGVSCVPKHAPTAHDLYSQADIALYSAKRAGRGRVGLLPAQHPSALPSPAGGGSATPTSVASQDH